MARARNIKPGFFKNEVLAEMPCENRLLFIGLWTLADREGRLEDRPKRIKMELFAYDSFDVDAMLGRLQIDGFLIRYEVDLIKYIQLVNFVKHQDPHYKEKASEIPPPAGIENVINATAITRMQRARILERDGYVCQADGCGSKEHLCIDHIIPASRGGDSSDDNLQVLCMSCNTKKGNRLDGEVKGMKKSIHNDSAVIVRSNIASNLNQRNNASPSDSLIPSSLIPDSLIPIEPSATPTGSANVFVPPDWIPQETWKAYCKTRSAKKAKNEPHALGLIVADLEKFKALGHDPVEVLNNSIKSGWAGVFEPKQQARASPGYQNIHDQRAEVTAILTGRKSNERTRNEHDITGESCRVA